MNKKIIIIIFILAFTTALGKQINPCKTLLYSHIVSKKYFKNITQKNVDSVIKLEGKFFVTIPAKINKIQINAYLNCMERELPLELRWVKTAKQSTIRQLGRCYGSSQNLKAFMKHQKIAGNAVQKKYAFFAIEYLNSVKKILQPILMARYKESWPTKKREAELLEAARRTIVEKYTSPLKKRINQINEEMTNTSITQKIEELKKEKMRIETQLKKLQKCI